VNQLPLATIGTAVGTALLPLLSRQVHAGDDKGAGHTLNRAMEYALLLTLPAALALIVSGLPIVMVLFGRGKFSHADAVHASQSLACYAIGLPSFVMIKVLAPGFFARGDTATPMKIAIAAVVFNLALNLAFMVPLKHMGPALASSLAGIANAGAMAVVLHRRGLMRADAQLRAQVPKNRASIGGDGGGAVVRTRRAVHAVRSSWGRTLVRTRTAGGAGAVVYFTGTILLGVVKVGR